MFYLILVSHGDFAQGLQSALEMIVGKRENVLAVGLKEELGAERYAAAVEKLIAPITAQDRIILLGDILGGSPLTTAMKVLADKGLFMQTRAFGGMNLPMALMAALSGENTSPDELGKMLLGEARNAVQEFAIEIAEDEEI
ncbi:PTS sugar transporter subunit IIA [Anaerosinus massiliensis]|uniref:PTS sugar transporter subunit IIA n=1 Tax=Massilibacillus massiliensis TaxID=1806837 RepID=UPI000DA62844|nr:PTS fructose transporter subunit IIA [Massilibacillus massiliensis]